MKRKTMVEALLKTYHVNKTRNNKGSQTGRIEVPSCLVNKKVKLRIVR